jgi:hypothetical protein
MMTKHISPSHWRTYFDEFTQQHLKDSIPENVTVEIASPVLGDQVAADNARLLGLTFDPRSRNFEIALEGVEHLVFHPVEIWVVEDAEGFVTTIELIRADKTKELVHLRRAGVPSL